MKPVICEGSGRTVFDHAHGEASCPVCGQDVRLPFDTWNLEAHKRTEPVAARQRAQEALVEAHRDEYNQLLQRAIRGDL